MLGGRASGKVPERENNNVIVSSRATPTLSKTPTVLLSTLWKATVGRAEKQAHTHTHTSEKGHDKTDGDRIDAPSWSRSCRDSAEERISSQHSTAPERRGTAAQHDNQICRYEAI